MLPNFSTHQTKPTRRKPITTVVVTHEVKDGEHWAKAWHKGSGSRHELLAKLGGRGSQFS